MTIKLNKYKSFDTESFVLDDDFIQLAKGKSVGDVNLQTLLDYYPEKKDEIKLAVDIVNKIQSKKKIVSQERKNQILSRIFKQHRNNTRIVNLKYAVAASLVLGLVISSILLQENKSTIIDFAANNQPISDKAELILADGEIVQIESKQSKIEYTEDGTSVSLNDTSKIKQAKKAIAQSYNQVNVPYGKRMVVYLSDGSIVHLNSGSRLIYTPVFDKKQREVYLEGEAFFEVSKDKERPFFVKTDELRVKVLGTKFAVQAFKKEGSYNTLLVEGSVSLSKNNKLFTKEQILKPNQKAELNNSKEIFEITEVENTENQIAWIYGYLVFENEDLKSLSEKVARYYNIEIEVLSNESEYKFSGKLDLKDSAERVIEGLSTIFKVKYEKQGNKIVFLE